MIISSIQKPTINPNSLRLANKPIIPQVAFCAQNRAQTIEESLKVEAKKIFGKNKEFLADDYKKLSENQITTLREYAKATGMKKEHKLLNFSYKQLKKAVEKEFPKGFTFVSVGRSPARYTRMFELDAYDVKYCPSISLKPGFSSVSKNKEYLNSYANYLDSIGISPQKVKNATKPFIFADYTETGGSLEAFKKLLNNLGINGKNVVFRSVNDDFWGFKYESKSWFDHLKKSFMCEAFDGEFFTGIKDYSPIPHLSAKPSWQKDEVTKTIASYREPFESKLMSFVSLDNKLGRNFLKKILHIK